MGKARYERKSKIKDIPKQRNEQNKEDASCQLYYSVTNEKASCISYLITCLFYANKDMILVTVVAHWSTIHVCAYEQ